MQKRRCVVALFALLLAAPAPDQGLQPQLRILVTNDDGIEAPGLRALCLELATIAEVTVCAPDANRSGASQSVTMGQTMRVSERELEGATRAVAVSGTPADAASFGILTLSGEKPFDLVVSGINRGANVGDVSHYSGTVGAAMEAAYRGISAIAVSQAPGADTAATAAFARRFVVEMRRHATIPGVVWSINAPATAKGPPVVAGMGGSYVQVASYRKVSDQGDAAVWRSILGAGPDGPDGCDTAEYLGGRVTVTPLRFDWTHERAREIAAGWELGDK